MRILCLFAVLSLSSTLLFSQDRTPPAAKFDAVGLVVSDIETSEKFYTEILGFTQFYEFSLDEAWADKAGMGNGKALSVKMFRLGGGPTAAALKLAYFAEAPAKKITSGIDVESGVNYLTLRYQDSSDVKKRIKSAGIPIVGEVVGPGYELFIVRDPDGVFIEIIQPPATN